MYVHVQDCQVLKYMYMYCACFVIHVLYTHMYHTDRFVLILFKIPRTEWVLQWPGQVVIAGCQTMWTTEVSEALDNGVLPQLYQNMLKQVHIFYTSSYIV